MWIFCCGMERSGSTLQFNLTSRIVEESGLGKQVEFVKPKMFSQLKKKYSKYDGYKVFKCHEFTTEIAKEFEQGNAIGIYVYRDVRDVWVSHMKKRNLSFSRVYKENSLERWINNYYGWTSLSRILVSRYESMIGDLNNEVLRISKFLQIDMSPSTFQKIAQDYTLEKQQKRIDISIQNNLIVKHEHGHLYNPNTLLHLNHISASKGKVNSYLEILSQNQVALVEKRSSKWLVENGYTLSTPLFLRLLPSKVLLLL